MKKDISRPFIWFFLAVLSFFSYGAVADERQVYELINAAFPPPNLVIKPDVEKALPVASPPLFRGGNGYFQNSKFGIGSGRHFDTNDPALSVSAIKS